MTTHPATPPSKKEDKPYAEGGAIPAGWKLVPIEPTNEMLAAMHQQIDWCRDDQNTSVMEHESQTGVFDSQGNLIAADVVTTCKTDLQDAYRAMLAAAASPSITAPTSPVIEREADGMQAAHADHPLRHYDRTCPACTAGVGGNDGR